MSRLSAHAFQRRPGRHQSPFVAAPLIGRARAHVTWKVEGTEHYDAIIRRAASRSSRSGTGASSPASTTSATAGSSSSRARTSTASGSRGSSPLRLRDGARLDVAGRRARARAAAPRPRAGPASPSPSMVRAVPRGWRRPGAVWLAGATGHPILPFHIEADRSWTMKSWDRTQIPKPYCTVAVVIGEPIEVRAALDDRGIEQARTELERALESLETRALQGAGVAESRVLLV